MKKTTGICCCCVLLGMALHSHPTQAGVSVDVSWINVASYFDTPSGYFEDEDQPLTLPDNPIFLPLSTSVDVPGGTVACNATFSTRNAQDASVFWAGCDVLLQNADVFTAGISMTNTSFGLHVLADEPFKVVYDFGFQSDYQPLAVGYWGEITDLTINETLYFQTDQAVYSTEIHLPPGRYRISNAAHLYPSDFGTAEGSFSITVVPEPSTLALTSFALLGLAFYGWRRRK